MKPVRIAALMLMMATASCSLFSLEVPPNVDRDNDNLRDQEDNCPGTANPDQSDKDGDGTGDACDECLDGGTEDVDADGIPDGCDGCIGIGADEDKDGIDDGCDLCIGEGTTNVDSDGDGIDDGCDTCIAIGMDSDGDGLDDECDSCDSGPQHDEDGDGVMDACDNCPAVANPGQEEEPGASLGDDKLGTACDPEIGLVDEERFDPFTTPDPSWFVQGAYWSLENDGMRFLGGDVSYRLLGSGQDYVQVQTTLQVESLTSGVGNTVMVFATTQQLQPSPTGLQCRLQLINATSGTVVLRASFSGTSVEASSGDVLDLTQPFTLKLVVNQDGSEAICFGNGNKLISATLPSKIKTLFPGIGSEYAAVRFAYYDTITR